MSQKDTVSFPPPVIAAVQLRYHNSTNMRANEILCCSAVAFVNNGLNKYGIRGQQCHQTLGNNIKQSHIISLFDGCDGIDDNDVIPQQHTQKRRMVVQAISQSIISSMLLITTNSPVHAACLPGDLSANCIGVYKTPIDAPESDFMDSPEKLKLYAPDLNWVEPVKYPKTYEDAISQLNQLRQQLEVAQDLVAKGDMEASGISLLDIIPKTNAAGITIVQTINKALINERNKAMKSKKRKDGEYVENPSTNKGTILEIEASRVQTALNELLGYLGEIDVLLGQGLRGDLGAPAPAQIQILENFAECKREFDNFLATIPEKPR